jgi:hypothetical protein
MEFPVQRIQRFAVPTRLTSERQMTQHSKTQPSKTQHSTRQHSKTTTDPDVIRRWAEEREGHPATVARTASDDDVGIIRIDFPGYSGENSLEEISWEEFFEKFEEKQLALVYQEKTADGKMSRFNKLVSRDSVSN